MILKIQLLQDQNVKKKNRSMKNTKEIELETRIRKINITLFQQSYKKLQNKIK